jgi:hypothetical protein
VAAVYLLLLAGFAAGLWGSYRAMFPGAGLYRVTGIFQARAGETLFVVSHDAVPGLMEEMAAMVFAAESRDLLDRADLRPGERVRLTVRQEPARAGDDPRRLVVVEVQKIR